MRTQYRMRNRVVASAAAAAMAASMVVAAPGAAFATYDTGEIHAKSEEAVSTAVGAQVDMADYFDYSASGGDGKWHVDYKVTDGTAATVNKHSGVLTATSEGTVTVTAYLTAVKKQQIQVNPCKETEVKATVTVEIADKTTYGFQGADVAIMMTDPTPTLISGNNTVGWKNALSGVSAVNGYYCFDMEMTHGFKDSDGADDFAALNAGNISVVKNGVVIDSLTANNNTGVQIDAADSDSKTFTVAVSAKVATAGAELVFGSDFRGKSAKNKLGTTVSFSIN